MKIKEIVRLAANFLQLDVNTEVFVSEDKNVVANEFNADRRLKLLKDCTDFVLNQLSEYMPLSASQRVRTTDGVVSYASFEKEISEATEVLNLFGTRVRFRHLPDGLEIDGKGEFDVRYLYRPGEKNFDDEAEVGNRKASAYVVALGVAAEYAFLCGMFDEARALDERFKDGLGTTLRKRSVISLKPRRWL